MTSRRPVIGVHRCLRILVFMCSCFRNIALPLYADASHKSLPLVLCAGLDRAVSNLRHQLLSAHAVGAEWLEEDCVAIDPCQETGAGGARAPRREWLHGNSSALATGASLHATDMAAKGLLARNFGSFEYARVPEGLVVRACVPNFDSWRRNDVLECDPRTIVEIDTVKALRSCPRTGPYTLIDCLQPLQLDASVLSLHWRPADEAMHFGYLPLSLACAVELPPVAALLCNRSRDDFVIEVPRVAPPELAHASLVWYDFAAGYGCHAPPADTTFVLSQVAGPNRVLPCPSVAHVTVWRNPDDPTKCDFDCIAPFGRNNAGCASPCAGLTSTCTHAAVSSCTDSTGQQFYNCTACPSLAGFETKAFELGNPAYACAYEGCAPGTASSEEHACTPCPQNSISSGANAHRCVSCNTSSSGLFSRGDGGTVCSACFAQQGSPGLCGAAAGQPGRGMEDDFWRARALFAVYSEDRPEVRLEDYVEEYCMQGYACLPCAPGTFEEGGVCTPCDHGTYQHNFGATACFECAAGQNTTARGQNSSKACVCVPGFE